MEGIKKFVELVNTDEEFQAKLKEALASYDGEKTEEAVFSNVLTPLANEYGINATFEEYKEYIAGTEMSSDELAQVAGGTAKTGGNNGSCAVLGNTETCVIVGNNPNPNYCQAGISIPSICMPNGK